MYVPRRYEPPYLTVKVVGNGEAPALFPKVNVEVTPEPQLMRFSISTVGGDLTYAYDPAPLIGEIIHFYARLLCPPVTVIPEYMEKLGCGRRGAKRYLAELCCDRMRMCVGTACNYARGRIEDYFGHTLQAVYGDAINHTFAARNHQAFTVEPVEGLIRPDMNEHKRRLRELVNLPTRGGRRRYYHDWTDAECVRLADLYERRLPEMREAKEIYKNDPEGYQSDFDWLLLWDEEVERLTDPDPYVSAPSTVALMSAARSLGLKSGLYQPRTLRRYLKRGQDLKKSGWGARAEDFWSIKVWV